MEWIAKALQGSPELAMFLAVAIGYWAGKFKIGNFSFGTVTASLLAGLVIGQLHVEINRELRWGLFLLFLFANGYSVGPQFFAALKRNGFKPMVLSVVVFITGLVSALIMARLLRLDIGMSAGLFAGALTHSAAIGTATDAIMALPLPEAERKLLANRVAVADALTYVFGALGVMLFASVFGPKLLRVDLRKEAEALETELGIKAQQAGILSGAQKFALRAYRLSKPEFAGKSVKEVESNREGHRYFVERIRRGDQIIEPDLDTALLTGDVLLLYGRHDSLVTVGPLFGDEVHDPELMDIPVAILEAVVTNANMIGPTLEELTRSEAFDLRSVGLRKLTRAGQTIPTGTQTVFDRGDVLELIGPQRAVERVAAAVGYSLRRTDATNLAAPGLGIVIGAAIGLPYLLVGNIKLTLSVSVGALLAGLFFGWLRSRRPTFGNIPAPALQFMIDFGLAAFVAGAGLQAGPEFVKAVKELGISVLLAGIVVTLVPQAAALAVGHYLLKMNPLLLLGGLTGAQTFTGGLAALQEKAGSRIPVLGYTVPYATSNVLLTAGGALIVALLL
jgi:putative transport protein